MIWYRPSERGRTRSGSSIPFDSIEAVSSERSPTLERGCSGLVSISSMEIQRPRAPPKRSESDSTKWESCRMRDSFGRPLLFALDTGKDLLGKRVILRRARRARREREDGFPVRRTLLEPNVLGDRRLEDLVAEDLGDLVVDVLADHRSFVVKRHDDAENAQVRVGARFDLLDRFEKVVGPLERKVRGLNWNQDVARCHH